MSSRPQTIREEIANSITHGIGAALSIAALVVLIVRAAQEGTAWHVVGVTIFGSSLFLLYLVSCLYHALPGRRTKHVFQVLDHSFIFILIAGTYTPFCLVNFRGPWGWTLFGLVWGIAAAGIAFKAVFLPRYDKIGSLLYVVMGWLVLIVAHRLLPDLGKVGVTWLAAGGVTYTVGVVFYALDSRVRFAHTVWHLFVMGGSLCHFFAVWHGVLS